MARGKIAAARERRAAPSIPASSLAGAPRGLRHLVLHLFWTSPAKVLALSVFTVIAAGTALLLHPAAVAPGRHISFVDALFTATSATCVTGLIVQNTASYFSPIGKTVVLVLIQVGGLGLMTFSTLAGLLLGRRLGIRSTAALKSILDLHATEELPAVLWAVIRWTVIIEGTGALLLFLFFLPYHGDGGGAASSAIFHSVSAFCNAGFSTYSGNLMAYRAHAGVVLTICSLIIVGGLGFGVLSSIYSALKDRVRGRYPRPSLQSKVALLGTLLLIVGGTMLFWAFERRSALTGYPTWEKFLASLVQVVTPRTAGFNTVDIGSLRHPTLILLMFLMFVGACPGSTGGGIKVTTFVVVLASIVATVRDTDEISLFRATIPRSAVRRAFAVATTYALFVVVWTLLLVQIEGLSLTPVLFEVLSATGTVGLSMGITPHLTSAGRVLLCVAMFAGRIGPLTLMLAVGGRKAVTEPRYAEEPVMVS